jgi:hypothetical protein
VIVLDEQLLGRDLERHILAWYRGAVLYIADLRPATVIKDDAIPALLRKRRQPTFVTINERDFWRRVAIDRDFCVVCFTLPDSRATEIPARLRNLFSHPLLRTKAQRMGKVVRVTERDISYYNYADRTIVPLT